MSSIVELFRTDGEGDLCNLVSLPRRQREDVASCGGVALMSVTASELCDFDVKRILKMIKKQGLGCKGFA